MPVEGLLHFVLHVLAGASAYVSSPASAPACIGAFSANHALPCVLSNHFLVIARTTLCVAPFCCLCSPTTSAGSGCMPTPWTPIRAWSTAFAKDAGKSRGLDDCARVSTNRRLWTAPAFSNSSSSEGRSGSLSPCGSH